MHSLTEPFQHTQKEHNIIFPCYRQRTWKLKFREEMKFVQYHVTRKWQGHNSLRTAF